MEQRAPWKDLTAKSFLSQELPASIVVFMVALPLCMGIAIASGVPLALGLITGIVGGLVVGFLAGAPLQVSGPAAGLALIIYELVREHGLEVLGPVVLIAGLIQLLSGFFKLGQWFRAVSPAVIQGMLAGIGVLIFSSQFHVMVDDDIPGGGVTNILTIPSAVYKGLIPMDTSSHHLAALIGVITIGTLIAWNFLRPKALKMVPGPLVAVIVATGATAIFGFPIDFVSVPDNLFAGLTLSTPTHLMATVTPAIIGAGIVTALVASAETLLCATAVDQLHTGPRAKYDRELMAQGVGNLICGFLGALPMTGVIVRSSANVEAGAKTRVSAILHGAWLLAFVVALPHVLELIPVASLAAILVYTGYKLMNPAQMVKLFRFNRVEFGIFIVTVAAIVGTDLLTGVLVGLGLSMLRLLLQFSRLDLDLQLNEPSGRADLYLKGAATFLLLPRIAQTLERIPPGVELHVHMAQMVYIDHACLELFGDWEKTRKSQGNSLVLEWQEALMRYKVGPKGGGSPEPNAAPSGKELEEIEDAVATFRMTGSGH